MNTALGLTASGLIRALSPQRLQPALAKRADRLAAELETALERRNIEARATANNRNGATTIELTGPNLWQREYGTVTEPEIGDIARAVQAMKGET